MQTHRLVLYVMIFVVVMTILITSHRERMKKLDGLVYATEEPVKKSSIWK